jgi:hypothetical protein
MSSAVRGRPSRPAIDPRHLRPFGRSKKDLFAIGNFRRSRQAYGNALPESQAALRAPRL